MVVSVFDSIYIWWWKQSEVAQSCLTLCNPIDCSLPGFSVHGIFEARILEWVAISFSRGCSWPKDRTQVSYIIGRCFTVWATVMVVSVFDGSICIWTFGTCLKGLTLLCRRSARPCPERSLVGSVESCTINHSGENSHGCAYQVSLNVTTKLCFEIFLSVFSE